MRSRGLVASLLLGVLLALPPCAHASPTDPTWIPGFYDDNDYDDVILFITGAVSAVDSQLAEPIEVVRVCLGLITPSSPQAVAGRPVRCLSTRAPPSHLA
jgi:hypothetical protein